ncbi:MAG: Coq4 family protein [Bradymonadia bacterium]
MRWLDNIRHAKRLYRADPGAHLGDVAVLKCDAFGVDVRPPLREALAPVRGWIPEVDLDRLAELPPNTFGHALARFMRQNQLHPFVITDEIPDDMRRRNAFGIRYATTHDMFHVLLDFDTTWVGEMGVLAFAVGQRYTRWQALGAALAWLIYSVRSGFKLRALWRAWRRGRAAGRRAPFLLGLRLEERFESDLNALRRELRL